MHGIWRKRRFTNSAIAIWVLGDAAGGDVEAAVDLAGVGGDDLDGGVLGQVQGEAGLAGGGGAGDDEEVRALGFRMCERQGPLSRLIGGFQVPGTYKGSGRGGTAG